jgi:hypothetical protein
MLGVQLDPARLPQSDCLQHLLSPSETIGFKLQFPRGLDLKKCRPDPEIFTDWRKVYRLRNMEPAPEADDAAETGDALLGTAASVSNPRLYPQLPQAPIDVAGYGQGLINTFRVETTSQEEPDAIREHHSAVAFALSDPQVKGRTVAESQAFVTEHILTNSIFKCNSPGGGAMVVVLDRYNKDTPCSSMGFNVWVVHPESYLCLTQMPLELQRTTVAHVVAKLQEPRVWTRLAQAQASQWETQPRRALTAKLLRQTPAAFTFLLRTQGHRIAYGFGSSFAVPHFQVQLLPNLCAIADTSVQGVLGELIPFMRYQQQHYFESYTNPQAFVGLVPEAEPPTRPHEGTDSLH